MCVYEVLEVFSLTRSVSLKARLPVTDDIRCQEEWGGM